MAISGSSGTGKTTVARALYRFSEAHGPDIQIAHGLNHWSSIMLKWPSVAEADDESDFREVEAKISESTFVVLDDIGSEIDRFKTGSPAARLTRILSLIEERRKWSVITTNFDRKKLVDSYDSRTADRLRAYNWMELGDIPSYRPKLT